MTNPIQPCWAFCPCMPSQGRPQKAVFHWWIPKSFNPLWPGTRHDKPRHMHVLPYVGIVPAHAVSGRPAKTTWFLNRIQLHVETDVSPEQGMTNPVQPCLEFCPCMHAISGPPANAHRSSHVEVTFRSLKLVPQTRHEKPHHTCLTRQGRLRRLAPAAATKA